MHHLKSMKQEEKASDLKWIAKSEKHREHKKQAVINTITRNR